jgi:transposase
MSTTISPVTPTRKTKTWLTRIQRLTVRALRSQTLTYEQIASQLGITYRQVQTACTADRPTPHKSRGQRRKLSEDQLDEIIEFITSSKETRRMLYKTVIKELQLPVCKSTLRKALARRRYHRRKALRKPPMTERTRIIRLNCALEHINWTREQWCKILWTDETWVTSTYHRQIYVTRRSREEFDETCVRERY